MDDIEQYLLRLTDCIHKMQSAGIHSSEFYQAYGELLFIDSGLYLAVGHLMCTDPQARDAHSQAMNIPDDQRHMTPRRTALEKDTLRLK